MGHEVGMTDFDGEEGGDEEERVAEWEAGLPSADEITPLSRSLVPPELASAFSISPEPRRSVLDVSRASRDTVSALRRQSQSLSSGNFKSFDNNEEKNANSLIIEGDDEENARKLRRTHSGEEADSAPRTENSKRPRLVWTPQLHKRFVDVVSHLGIKNAVPKTIMQLMNVEGLTRENVASHLQKYRLYLKRTPGLSEEPRGNGDMPPVPYGNPAMGMPVYGMAHGHGQIGMPHHYHGFESNPYS